MTGRFYTTVTGEQMPLPEISALTRAQDAGAAEVSARIAELEAEAAAIEGALDSLQAERAKLRDRRRAVFHELRCERDRAAYLALQRRQEIH